MVLVVVIQRTETEVLKLDVYRYCMSDVLEGDNDQNLNNVRCGRATGAARVHAASLCFRTVAHCTCDADFSC